MRVDLAARVKSRIADRNRLRRYKSLYEKYSNFTMVGCGDYISNLLVTQDCEGVAGCIVECGTWRGGMIAGMADLLGPKRRYFLFDSFEGLPPADAIDGPAALAWQANTDGPRYYDNCKASIEWAEKAMAMSRATDYRIMKGWFDGTLPDFEPPEPVAILRLDADWYESTLVCLRSLFRYMSKGGVVILDDYFTWDGCSRALHHFLAETKSDARIATTRGVCVVRPGS